MTDPIADMLTRIRNATAKHSRVDIPASKLKLEIARILKEEGYINNFVIKGEGLKRTVRIFALRRARHVVDYALAAHLDAGTSRLRRFEGDPESARWLRYQYRLDLERSDERQKARRENIGGELLAQIY